MSRWAETFAQLSRGSDTLDTTRHSEVPRRTVSQSVHSVTAVPEAPAGAGEFVDARWGEAEQERTAIMEHDGNIPRVWAEGASRLDPDRPPGDVPLQRWHRFVDDVGLFLDSPFCAVAVALGWGPYDLFGCDRDRAFAPDDPAEGGLLWRLNGDRLVALSENIAVVERRAGARQRLWRRPAERGQILTWELSDASG